MDQKQQISEEEQKEIEKVDAAIRPAIDRFLSKTYSMLSWCWPATILMFVGREILRLFGYYGISNWAVTVFLWLPFAIVMGVTALIVGFCYVFSLLTAWKEFIAHVLLCFKIGFDSANKKEGNNE